MVRTVVFVRDPSPSKPTCWLLFGQTKLYFHFIFRSLPRTAARKGRTLCAVDTVQQYETNVLTAITGDHS